MTIKSYLKFLGIFMFITSIVFVTTSGGGRGKNPSGNNSTVTGTTKLVIMANFTKPSERAGDMPVVPVTPNIWTGAKSANSLSGAFNSEYFCKVTVTYTDNNVVNEYVWNPDGGRGSVMTITTPANGRYRLKVEYYEQCGKFWKSGVNGFGRGLWSYEQVFFNNTSKQIAVDRLVFVKRINC